MELNLTTYLFKSKPKSKEGKGRRRPVIGDGHERPSTRLMPCTSSDAHGWCIVRQGFPWYPLPSLLRLPLRLLLWRPLAKPPRPEYPPRMLLLVAIPLTASSVRHARPRVWLNLEKD